MNEQRSYEDEVIPQNHERGPGWFLKISYIIVGLFCIYYLVTHWDWKSGYDEQQERIHTELTK